MNERIKQLLIDLNNFYEELPDDKASLTQEELKRISLNADQIQHLAEDIKIYCLTGKKNDGSIEPQ